MKSSWKSAPLVLTVFFVCLSENVACVHAGKSEDHFLFFLVIHQKMVDETFFGKNGRSLGKFTKGA